MQHKQSKQSRAVADDNEEDDYENDFEDYGDDFEEEEEEPKIAPSKNISVPIPSAKAVPNNISSTTAIQSEAKKSGSSSTLSAKQTRNSIGSSLARSIVDPRSVRVQRILASNVLDLKLEKATLLNILPTSKYDLYINELRSENSTLRQMGVPIDLEARDMEVATDDIFMSDKEVQFCNGDDTKFLNTLKKIEMKRVRKSVNAVASNFLPESSEVNRPDIVDGTQLSEFLRRSSMAVEKLLTEEKLSKLSSKSTDRDNKLLTQKNSWRDVGKDTKDGSNELLRNRRTSIVRFSECQNNVFLTVHPFSPSDSDDLRPFKTLIAIWSTDRSEFPLFVLEGSGDICAACFSASQPHFVVGGTSDGCVYMWDLREASSYHRDRDSVDLKIQQGIRKPSFSTLLLPVASNDHHDVANHEIVHNSSILDIVSTGSSASSTSLFQSASSQFVSLDQTGKMIFWVSQDRPARDNGESLCVSPWSRVELIPTKTLTHTLRSALPTSRSQSSWLDSRSGLYSAPDDSLLLLPDNEGKVNKVVRIGEPSAPQSLARAVVTESINNNKAVPSFSFSTQVTCISFRESSINSSYPPLILVGRIDGSVDLFQLDQQFPILSWNLGNILTSRNVESSVRKQSIVLLRWMKFCHSSFLAVDGSGILHHFDLLMDIYKPFRSESLGIPMTWQPGVVDMSFPSSHVESLHIACLDRKNLFKVRIRQINVDDIFTPNPPSETDDEILFNSLSHSTVSATQEKRVLLGVKSEEK